MNQKEAESVKHLAKPCNSALSIIVKSMAMECPECKGKGRFTVFYPGDKMPIVKCPKCNGTGKITQETMNRQATESIRKKEHGKYQLVYKKATRTIVAEPRGWEWEPELFQNVSIDGMIACVTSIDPPDDRFNLPRKIALRNGFDKDFTGHYYKDEIWLTRNNDLYIIPILGWEEIRSVLEKVGYKTKIETFDTDIAGEDGHTYKFSIFMGGKKIAKKMDYSIQQATMKAVIELAKGIK